MPANEANGIGGRSYGRIALYLLQVSEFHSSFVVIVTRQMLSLETPAPIHCILQLQPSDGHSQ